MIEKETITIIALSMIGGYSILAVVLIIVFNFTGKKPTKKTTRTFV